MPEPAELQGVVMVEARDRGMIPNGRRVLTPSNGAGTMRSILLWFLGVPIPIIILIALFVR